MTLLILTQKIDENDPVLGFFCKWIEKFAEHFAKVEVIALEVGTYKLPPNVAVFSLGKEKRYGRLRRILKLKAYSLQLKYDCVFVHMNPEYLALFGWYWKLTRKRTALWYTHKSVTWWLRVAEKFADKIFTASRESFRLPSKKTEVVGHGIDMDLFTRTLEHENTRTNLKLLSVGRIAPSKDLETIILAVKKLRDQGAEVVLDIVGAPAMNADFNYERVIRELIQKLNLQEYINFLGPRNYNEMPGIYHSHDLLIHASKTGSIDKVALESLSSGIAVLSSSEAFHSFPEHLRFKENDPVDLAAKIHNFFQVKPDITKLVESVRARNDLDKLIQSISRFFKSLP